MPNVGSDEQFVAVEGRKSFLLWTNGQLGSVRPMDTVFGHMRIIGSGEAWKLYRDGDVFVVRYHGAIDDDASTAWREAAIANVTLEGWPRGGIVAPTEGTAVNSLSSRMRTASFLRRCSQELSRVVILTDDKMNFVIKTILRAAGLDNVEVVPADEATRVLAEMRATFRR